jgi:hypothetical protein
MENTTPPMPGLTVSRLLLIVVIFLLFGALGFPIVLLILFFFGGPTGISGGLLASLLCIILTFAAALAVFVANSLKSWLDNFMKGQLSLFTWIQNIIQHLPGLPTPDIAGIPGLPSLPNFPNMPFFPLQIGFQWPEGTSPDVIKFYECVKKCYCSCDEKTTGMINMPDPADMNAYLKWISDQLNAASKYLDEHGKRISEEQSNMEAALINAEGQMKINLENGIADASKNIQTFKQLGNNINQTSGAIFSSLPKS